MYSVTAKIRIRLKLKKYTIFLFFVVVCEQMFHRFEFNMIRCCFQPIILATNLFELVIFLDTLGVLRVILTYLGRMEFPIFINWTSQFPLGVIFHFHFNFKRIFCKHTVETLIRRHILWCLIWVCTACLPMSHKKEARLIWVYFVCLFMFDLILYVPSTIFQLYRDEFSWVEPVLN